jgi:hypothetical protein
MFGVMAGVTALVILTILFVLIPFIISIINILLVILTTNLSIMQPHLILPYSHTQTYCNPVDFDVQLLPQYSTYYPHFTSEATPCSERPNRNHVILEFFVPQSYVALNSLLPFLLLPLSAFRLPYQVLVEKQKQTDRQKDRNKEQDR